MCRICFSAIQEEIKRVLKAISAAAHKSARDFSRAEALIKQLHNRSELHDDAIIEFADGKNSMMVASIALLGGAPTEMIAQLLEGPRSDLILITLANPPG